MLRHDSPLERRRFETLVPPEGGVAARRAYQSCSESVSLGGGTESSNLLPSSGESATNCCSRGRSGPLPMMPAIDDRLTIDPPPLATMAGIAYLRPKNTPVAFTAMIRCQASVL